MPTLEDALDRIWAAKLRPPDDFTVFFATPPQKGALSSVTPPELVWRFEPLHRKLKSILDGHWNPDMRALIRASGVTFIGELLGGPEDFGPDLMRTLVWHHAQHWDLSAATDEDRVRAEALSTFSQSTLLAFRDYYASRPTLSLVLGEKYPQLCRPIYLMVVRVPICTLRYGLDIMAEFTFSAIRRSQHPEANGIIAYLYELLFLQQKTAVALLDYLKLADEVRRTKRDALLTLQETQLLIRIDAIVPYLKATVEKTLGMLGAVFGVSNLPEKRTHKAKLKALREAIPENLLKVSYAELLMEMVDPDALSKLNSYRTGMLHKRGISRLQPHSYSGVAPSELRDLEVFADLHAQHARNTAALVAALAMLTDDLVRRDPPEDRERVQAELFLLMEGDHPYIG